MSIGGTRLAVAPGKIRFTPQSMTEFELSQAITTGQLVVHYQPKATFGPAGAWRIEGVEALVRWQHPRCGLLMPNEFIPLAQKTALISPLTDFVLRTALGQAGRWQASGWLLSVAVNLAPRLLSQMDLPDRLSRLVNEYGIDGSKLVLEITESGALVDDARILDVLTRLRLKGIGISVDDFGTGASSLIALCRMPFNELKIDQSLIADLHRDRESRTIVRSIVNLARNLGISVCAEGAETEETVNAAHRMGCEKAQGHCISKPLPALELAEFLSGRCHGAGLEMA